MRLALQLAWKQLSSHRIKLITGVTGVVFACVLIFAQLGFKGALFDSATAVQSGMSGDLFLLHHNTNTLMQPHMFARARLQQALMAPDVTAASGIYVGMASWKNPWNHTRRMIYAFGVDPVSVPIDFQGLREQLPKLRQDDVALFDVRSRPEFGDVGAGLKHQSAVPVEVNDRSLQVKGTFALGVGFAADGNMMVSANTFMRLFPDRGFHAVDIGVLSLRPGADPLLTQRQLAKILAPEIRVLTHAEFVKIERDYWEQATPIGAIFSLGVVMGLIVGVVVVYQVLYTEIANHLSEYATLKAIGYSNGFLVRVVLAAGLILAVLGYIPSLLAALSLYAVVEHVAFLKIAMPWSRVLGVLVLTISMCLISAFLAVRRLRAADPADVF